MGTTVQLVLSGKFSHDLYDSASAALASVKSIVEQADLEDISAEIDGMVIFPVIISDEFGVEQKSHRSFSRKERSEFVNVEIDAYDWASATPKRQIKLMMAAVCDAITGTRPTRINERAKDDILLRLQQALERHVS